LYFVLYSNGLAGLAVQAIVLGFPPTTTSLAPRRRLPPR
jgi:hypothetical protein